MIDCNSFSGDSFVLDGKRPWFCLAVAICFLAVSFL